MCLLASIYVIEFVYISMEDTMSLTTQTISLVRSVWMTVNRAWYTMGSPASVSNAKVNIKLQIQVNILLF